jgi:hypothetical protein
MDVASSDFNQDLEKSTVLPDPFKPLLDGRFSLIDEALDLSIQWTVASLEYTWGKWIFSSELRNFQVTGTYSDEFRSEASKVVYQNIDSKNYILVMQQLKTMGAIAQGAAAATYGQEEAAKLTNEVNNQDKTEEDAITEVQQLAANAINNKVFTNIPGRGSDDQMGWYVSAEYQWSEKLSTVLRYGEYYSDTDNKDIKEKYRKDITFALAYIFTENVLGKLEYHIMDGAAIGAEGDPENDGGESDDWNMFAARLSYRF